MKLQLSEARHAATAQPVSAYEFADASGRRVTLKELFGRKRDLLVVHNMGSHCPYCTMWADGFNGLLEHISDRASFVISTPDAPATMSAFASARGWSMRMVSCGENSFTRDMGFENGGEKHLPGVSAFHMEDDGSVVRTGYAHFGPGDDFCAVWPLFDLLQGGAGTWEPQLEYVL